jgi:hypothetical protein
VSDQTGNLKSLRIARAVRWRGRRMVSRGQMFFGGVRDVYKTLSHNVAYNGLEFSIFLP